MAMDSRELDSPLVDLDALPDIRADLHNDLHIQAIVGSDRDSPNSLKRGACDVVDGDQSTAKKRRKQSKPVRINAGEGAALSDALSEVLGDVLQGGVAAEPRVSPSLDLEVQVHCQTEGKGREEIPLNLCSLPKTEPSSPLDLEDFPAIPSSSKAGSPSGFDVDPLSAHQDRIASQAINNFWGMSAPFLYPMVAPEQSLPQSLPQSNNHQSRCSPDNRTGACTIFNPDAYCELCNKEFCNKYFLKTHKANKHGIFSNSPTQPPQQQIQQTSPCNNASEAFQQGLLVPRTLSPSSDNVMKISPATIRAQKDLPSAKHAKNLFQRKIKVKSFGSNGDDISLPSVDRVKPDNEYFDADVERILSRMSPQVPTSQTGEVVSRRPSERDEIPQLNSKVSNVAVHEEGGEGGSAGDSNESTGILRKDVQNQEIVDKPVFTPEKMRSLGVINPEAFCEICCKEYCNKYFLRTHKWKRHGIAPPEGEEKESMRSTPSWIQQLQQHAAPLNLIMEDPSNHGDALCKFCGQWFPSDQVLQVHIAFVHLPVKKEKDGDFNDIIPRKSESSDVEKSVERNSRTSGERKADQIESIMDDMKKVQTMLFQLNTLNASQITVQPEETRSLVTSNSNPDQTSNLSGASTVEAPLGPSFAAASGPTCSLCKKSFPDKNGLQQHMQEQHWSGSAPQVKTEKDADTVPTTAASSQGLGRLTEGSQEQPEPKPPPVTSTPTSSYCEICNKELCNKYFMKTHMQRMHGIEIENGSQIGGVVCDICNKELCSKYFLRVHKQNTHGIVDETTGPPTQVRDSAGIFNLAGGHFLDAGNQALKPTDLSEMSHRYFTHFNEVCNICNRRFRSVKWLKAHLMNDHGRSEYEAAAETSDRVQKIPPPPPGLHGNELGHMSLGPPSRERARPTDSKSRQRMAQDGNPHSSKNGNHYMSNLMHVGASGGKEYRCSYCPFSTPVLAFLYVHEKTHTGLAYLPASEQKPNLQCPLCFKTCSKPEQYQRHLLSHQFAGLPGPGPMFPGIDPRSSSFSSTGQNSANSASSHRDAKREKNQPRATPERDDESVASEMEDRVSNRFVEPVRHREGSPRERRKTKCPKCANDVVLQGLCDRCSVCGYALESARKDRDISSFQSLLKETVTSDVKKRLEDAAKLNDIPASYAVPKTQDSDSDPFIMQPFIIEEPRGEEEEQGLLGGASSVDKKFVPSLVFLPVKERLSRPLTASFTLTPA